MWNGVEWSGVEWSGAKLTEFWKENNIQNYSKKVKKHEPTEDGRVIRSITKGT